MKPTEFLREFNEKDTGEYNDEAGMALSNLETICRSARELEKHIGAEENLPEWCQEKLAVVKGMLTAVTDYMVSQDSLDAKQDDFAFDTDRIAEQLDTMLEGPGYNHGFADPNAPSLKRSRERDSGDDEPAGVFTVVINGRDWKTATSNEAFRMASAVARKHPGKKVQVRWPNGALNSVNEAEGSEQKKPLRTHKSGCGYNYGHDCDCGGTLTHASDCHHNYGHDCDCGVDKLKQNKQQGVAEAGEWTKLPNGNWRNMHTGVQQSTPPKTKKPRRTMGLDASLEQHADDKMKELGHKFKPIAEMDGDGAGRDGSNRKRIGSYGNRDRDISGPDVHLGPEHAMKRKDINKRAGDVLNKEYDKAHKKGVAEAGNKPLEKSRFGTGDTRTPRDIKSQMSGASDEFVKSIADKTTGPFHSKVAKMQGNMER